MKAFAYVEPDTLAAATQALAKAGPRARLIAGGVDLLGELKDRLIEPEMVVNLKSVPGLGAIRVDADQTVRIGALVTLSALASHDVVRRAFPAVAEAAESVASPEIRNVGTVGGNLCQRPRCWYYRSPLHACLKKGGSVCFTMSGDSRYHAILGGGPSFIVHPSDLAPALIACEAKVTIAGPAGQREIPLEKLYVLPRVRIDHETILQPGEIITEVALPAGASTAAGTVSRYLKFKEKDSFDFALVSVAAALRMQGGKVAAARLVLGAVAPVPWRSKEGETALVGSAADAAAAARAADAALADADPLPHNGYKVPLAKTLIQRVVLGLAGGANAGAA